jgi:hypothetical protein
VTPTAGALVLSLRLSGPEYTVPVGATSLLAVEVVLEYRRPGPRESWAPTRVTVVLDPLARIEVTYGQVVPGLFRPLTEAPAWVQTLAATYLPDASAREVIVTTSDALPELHRLIRDVEHVAERIATATDGGCAADHDRREQLDREIATAATTLVDELEDAGTLTLTGPLLSDLESYRRLTGLAEQADEVSDLARAEALRHQAGAYAEAIASFFAARIED